MMLPVADSAASPRTNKTRPLFSETHARHPQTTFRRSHLRWLLTWSIWTSSWESSECEATSEWILLKNKSENQTEAEEIRNGMIGETCRLSGSTKRRKTGNVEAKTEEDSSLEWDLTDKAGNWSKRVRKRWRKETTCCWSEDGQSTAPENWFH